MLLQENSIEFLSSLMPIPNTYLLHIQTKIDQKYIIRQIESDVREVFQVISMLLIKKLLYQCFLVKGNQVFTTNFKHED